jgi:hypothetical protein
MGGSTKFKLKLSELPPTFSPGNTNNNSGGSGGGGGSAGIKIQWGRYL